MDCAIFLPLHDVSLARWKVFHQAFVAQHIEMVDPQYVILERWIVVGSPVQKVFGRFTYTLLRKAHRRKHDRFLSFCSFTAWKGVLISFPIT